jgi:hypothetical protein
MYGARGMIIVVPSASRVMPVQMIVHRIDPLVQSF